MDLFEALERDKPKPAPTARPRKTASTAREVSGGMAPVVRNLLSPVGTAPAAGDRAGGGAVISRRPKVGDAMIYRSMWSGDFNARVTTIRFPGLPGECVDLDVYSDSGKLLMHATSIPVSSIKVDGQASAYFGERPAR